MSTNTVLRRVPYFLLLCYFGLNLLPTWTYYPGMCFPLYFTTMGPLAFHWYDRYPSPFRVWLITLPVILLLLVVIGIWGMIGLQSKNERKTFTNSTYKSFIKLSGFGFLAFVFSSFLSVGFAVLQGYQKFDVQRWQNPPPTDQYDNFTPRHEMVNDLTHNILPGNTLDEVEALLGPSEWGASKMESFDCPDLVIEIAR